MNLVEHLFGVSPDGGSGALELLLILFSLAILACAYIARWRATAS
jgi:hypothetical protein